VKCETVDLEVPANAEIVLEGYVNLDELRTEGPSRSHRLLLTGRRVPSSLTCVTHRKDPIYATTVVGKPPQEDAWMGRPSNGFPAADEVTIPELVDINLPLKACSTT